VTRIAGWLVQDLAEIHDVLKNIFLLFPNYCLGRGLMDVAFNEYYNQFCFKMGPHTCIHRPQTQNCTQSVYFESVTTCEQVAMVIIVVTVMHCRQAQIIQSYSPTCSTLTRGFLLVVSLLGNDIFICSRCFCRVV